MAGLIGMGQSKRDSALAGFSKVANMEADRKRANQTLKANSDAAEKSQQSTLAGTGAALGMMAAGGATGLAMATPIGLGVAGGLILSSLF